MNQSKSLRQVISVIWCGLLLLLSNPAAIAQSSGVSATATMINGTVYYLENIQVMHANDAPPGASFYYNGATFPYLPVKVKDVALFKIPFEQIQRFEVQHPDKENNDYNLGLIVTLLNGKKLSGSLTAPAEAPIQLIDNLNGSAIVAGYKADFSIGAGQIAQVDVSHEKGGAVSAMVTARDGTITRAVSNLSFDTRATQYAVPEAHFDSALSWKMGKTVVTIPLTDIRSIEKTGSNWTLILKKGGNLAGNAAVWELIGDTVVDGLNAEIGCEFQSIKSILFKNASQ